MKQLVLILSLLTVNLVASLKLRPEVLQHDLEAISNYYTNFDDSLVAYINWPEEITFHVRLTEEQSKKFLKIDGSFTNSKFVFAVASYDGLYYRNNKFYVKAESNGLMTKISRKDSLYYSKQPVIISLETSFLSIKYFGKNEIMPRAQLMYHKKKKYYKDVLPTYPVTFLMTFPGTYHVLEYSFWPSKRWKSMPIVEGGLRVLTGSSLMARRSVERSIKTSQILIDPETLRITIPSDNDDAGLFKRDPFYGVRMASVGFLVERRGSKVRMLNTRDVTGLNGQAIRHEVYTVDFLTKVRYVEPRFNGHPNGFTSMPSYGRFLLNGHIFLKRLNYVVDNHELDPQCPFLIEFNIDESYFLFGSSEEGVKHACTDDIRVWPKGEPFPVNRHICITLVRPFARN